MDAPAGPRNNFRAGLHMSYFQNLVCWLESQTLVSWLEVIAELLVAGVIYLEFEHGRLANFCQRTTHDKMGPARATLYREFLEFSSCDLKVRSDKLKENICAEADDKEGLRTAADSQIALMNELGLMATRWFAPNSSRWFAFNKNFTNLFPHIPVFLWVTLRSYIVQRRKDSGPLFAMHLLRYTSRCFDLVIKKGQPLYLRSYGSHPKNLEITIESLKELRNEIDALLSSKPLSSQN
jgi:hypothetical protein